MFITNDFISKLSKSSYSLQTLDLIPIRVIAQEVIKFTVLKS